MMNQQVLGTTIHQNTLVLVGCGSRKGPVAAPAAELYQGSLFCASLRHARSLEEKGAKVRILSARHGVLDPAKVIEPYDQTLTSAREIDAWADRVVCDVIRDNKELLEHSTLRVVLLAGKTYADPVVALLRQWCAAWPGRAGKIVVERPLHRLTMGRRLAWLKSQAESAP